MARSNTRQPGERTPLSSLIRRGIGTIAAADRPGYIAFKTSAGKILFQVHEDHIFDHNGNRFAVDVD